MIVHVGRQRQTHLSGVFFGTWDSLDWRLRKLNAKNIVLLYMLMVQRDWYYFLLQVFLFPAFYVNKESGKYGSFKRVVALWFFMKWLRPQRKDNRWIVEIGSHYTRQFGSPENIKKNIFK